MKAKLFLSAAFGLLLAAGLRAQAPLGINYQAVARDAGGVLMANNNNISVRITVTDGNNGPTMYQETHGTGTNQYGLFNISVGQGNVVSGSFSSIPWGSSSPWMKVEMDASGGTNYSLMGSQQLMSVPYALHAAGTTGTAGGDLSGSYPNPGVDGLQGVGVSTTAPANGQVLKYNGTQWAPGADQNTSYTAGTGISITGGAITNTVTDLNDLTDVNTNGAASGQVLKYNGTEWTPGTDNTAVSSGAVNTTPRISGDGTAGSPIDIAQQGASNGQVLGWNGAAWAPQNGTASSWESSNNDIYNSNSGNVGVGTNAPAAKLDVAGNIALNNNPVLLRDGGDSFHLLQYDPVLDGTRLAGFNGGALGGTASDGNVLRWTWDGSNGSVGIGTDTPGAKLDVNGNFRLFDGTQGAGKVLTSDDNGIASWQTQTAVDPMWTPNGNNISNSNSGNVGIGTANPATPLHVGGNGRVDGGLWVNGDNSTGNSSDRLYFGSYGTTGESIGSWRPGDFDPPYYTNGLDFRTANTRRMYIANNGRVQIGIDPGFNTGPEALLHVIVEPNDTTYASLLEGSSAGAVEAISKKLAQENGCACELDKALEVEAVILVADHGTPEVVEPSEATFDLPSPLVSAEHPAILGL